MEAVSPTSPTSSSKGNGKKWWKLKRKSKASLNNSSPNSPLTSPSLEKHVQEGEYQWEGLQSNNGGISKSTTKEMKSITPSVSYHSLQELVTITPSVSHQPQTLPSTPPFLSLTSRTNTLSTQTSPSLQPINTYGQPIDTNPTTANSSHLEGSPVLRKSISEPKLPKIIPRPTKASLMRTTGEIGTNKVGSSVASPVKSAPRVVLSTAERSKMSRESGASGSGTRRDSIIGAPRSRRESGVTTNAGANVRLTRTAALRTGVEYESPVKLRTKLSASNLSSNFTEAIPASPPAYKEVILATPVLPHEAEVEGLEENLSVHTRESSASEVDSGASDRLPIGKVAIMIPPQNLRPEVRLDRTTKLRLGLEVEKAVKRNSVASFDGVAGHKQVSTAPIILKPPTIVPRINRAVALRAGKPDPQPLRPPPIIPVIKPRSRLNSRASVVSIASATSDKVPSLPVKLNRTELLRKEKREEELKLKELAEKKRLRLIGTKAASNAFV